MAFNLDQSYTTGQDDDSIGKLRVAADNSAILGQSFTPALSGKLNKIELNLKRIGTPTGNIWIEIHADGADPSAATQLGSDSVTIDAVNGVSTSYGDITFTFPASITLSPGTEYWILLYGDYALGGVNNIYWGTDSSSPTYDRGIAGRFGNGGVAWEDQPTYDRLFKEYSDDAPDEDSAYFM